MNKAIRIASILMLVVLVIVAFSVPVLGVNPEDYFEGDTTNTEGITSLFNNIIGIVQIVGTGIAIIMLIVLAIKYLVAAPSEKADIKKGALMYVVAAVNILAAIQGWASEIDIAY